MALDKFTIDTTNKLFICKAGVTEFDVKRDLYSDAKQEWLLGGTEMGFDFPMRVNPLIDNVINPISGTIIPLYAYMRGGWRIRPDEADHVLTATNGILLVDGGGDPFVDTLGAFTVRVLFEQPVQAVGTSLAEQEIEGGINAKQALAVMLAAIAAGKTDGAGSPPGPFHIRDLADVFDRVTVNYDASGNRTSVTLNLTGI